MNGSSTDGDFTGRRILVVDDEAPVAEGIAMLLEIEGASVTIVGSAAEALSRVDSGFVPELFIIDLGLPGITGDQLHVLLRERLPDTPIVVSSGYGDRERIEPLLRDPQTRFLQKPYEMSALYQIVGELLRSAEL